MDLGYSLGIGIGIFTTSLGDSFVHPTLKITDFEV